ncbi:MAG TPA: asparagine synthase (glutamine-hydrolyzing) [Stellaceae bacterium]|nr:asparagine synthase (glutamine-hydrolyzing) [Stellaceae bacterium]
MCGIWFSLGFAPDPAYIDIVAHRGPDGRGWQVFDSHAGPVALGHRRLSIIDLSDAGAQPMSYADGRYWIVYNGEIYNYLELRAELAAAGHFFTTQSDTEVLLAAYAQWGEAAFDRLVGMFSFVLWDRQAQTAVAVRDRFGIKPLYVAATAQGVAFASEIKQLLALPGIGRHLNVARVYDFLSSGIMDHTGETMFEEIRQLEGGTSVRLDLQHWHPGEALPINRWYRILEPGTLDLDERNAAQQFGALLSDAVRLHLRSDVPVGTCLSGGLDSSSIVCLMARELAADGGGHVHSISACYDEKSVDERPFMEAIVDCTDSTPHWCYPRYDDAFAEAERITWHQDEPYGSTSIFAQWSVFTEARQAGLKVMLDGQGADEQLAGYHGSFAYHYASLIKQRRFAALARAMAERQKWHGVRFADQARSLLLPVLPQGLARHLRRERQTLVQHPWLNGEAMQDHLGRSAFETARQHIGRPPIAGIGDLCVVLTQSSNLAMLLHWEDRNSMAHSIEARVPFLDHRLVEFSIGLGDRHKIVGGDTKRVLRRAMAGILPETVRQRRDKLGFATPEEAWFRGPLRELVRAGIDQTLALYPTLLNRKGVEGHAADMLEGRRPVDFSLWRIVSLGIWGRVFGVAM